MPGGGGGGGEGETGGSQEIWPKDVYISFCIKHSYSNYYISEPLKPLCFVFLRVLRSNFPCRVQPPEGV